MTANVTLPGTGAIVETLDTSTSGATNGTTAAGNAILHFAATPRNVAAGMVVANTTTPSSITAGSKVLSFTSTTVTMDQNAIGAGVGNGDTITFAGFQRQRVALAPADGSNQDPLGATDETAPASDTVQSGINGRLQRIAQRITTLIGTALTIASQGYSSSLSITRTADANAYTGNDVIGTGTGAAGASLTFANAVGGAGEYMITSAALEIDDSAIISGETSYRLYLYNVTPPSALGDNAAFDLSSGDRAAFLGYIDLGAPNDIGSTLYIENNILNKQIKAAGTSLFGYLVTNTGYTPTSGRVYKVTLHTALV